MKEIISITPKGVTYSDEEGNQQFIDFESCYQNFILDAEKSLGSKYTDADEEFYEKLKNVGTRLTFRTPPAIEFYTVPRVHFDFPTRDELWAIVSTIKKAGWRVRDGE